MKIDDALITYLEELSRLALTPEEKSEVKENLSDILAYMAKLDQLNTDGTEELSHPFPSVNRFRPDAVTPSLDRAAILENAPAQKDGCFQVPKTVESV